MQHGNVSQVCLILVLMSTVRSSLLALRGLALVILVSAPLIKVLFSTTGLCAQNPWPAYLVWSKSLACYPRQESFHTFKKFTLQCVAHPA